MQSKCMCLSLLQIFKFIPATEMNEYFRVSFFTVGLGAQNHSVRHVTRVVAKGLGA